jgi:glycosyltransferase involved in cell wall biosynthesis
MRIVHLNSDKGIQPGRNKGAAVHLCAMREAFSALEQDLLAIDEHNPVKVERSLLEAHAQAPIDLIYERLALNAYAGSAFASALRIPHVLELNAPLDEEAARHRGDSHTRPDQAQLAIQLQQASLLLCVSEDVAAWARAKGAAEARICVAGNGVDAQRFHPQRRNEEILSLSLPDAEFVIGFHGRLRPWHGFERLVAATEALLQQGHAVHLLMLGEGDFEAVIQDKLPSASWTHLPWVDHAAVGAYVARFDVLPLSYAADQPCYFSPLKLLEAMAAGVPVVVPNLGDLPATVLQGQAGLIYDAGDPEALAASISKLIEDAELRSTLALEGCRVAESHSWNSIALMVLQSVGGN